MWLANSQSDLYERAKEANEMSKKTRTHPTWSLEYGDGKCPRCASATVLVTPFSSWNVDCEDLSDDVDDCVEVHDEVSGHYCTKCERLVSLSLNTLPEPT